MTRILVALLLLAGCTPRAPSCDLDMARAVCGSCNFVRCTGEKEGEYYCTQIACVVIPDGGTD